jgi:putative endonuclease
MQSNDTAKNASTDNNKSSWFVYILRCADNTLYTGITTDVDNRIKQHNGVKKGAKYTRNRQPVQLVYQEVSDSRSDASKREYSIKSLKKRQKEHLVDKYQGKHDNETLK